MNKDNGTAELTVDEQRNATFVLVIRRQAEELARIAASGGMPADVIFAVMIGAGLDAMHGAGRTKAEALKQARGFLAMVEAREEPKQ